MGFLGESYRRGMSWSGRRRWRSGSVWSSGASAACVPAPDLLAARLAVMARRLAEGAR